MAITAVLVEASSFMLKYLLTQDGASTGSPATDSTLVIPNGGGATPDLRTDALAGSVAENQSALQRIVRARIDGYPPLAAGALTRAQARSLLNSDDAANAVLTNKTIVSCRMHVYPRSQGAAGFGVGTQLLAPVTWLCDADVDVSGDPVVAVFTARRPPAASTAYLEIKVRHTIDH